VMTYMGMQLRPAEMFWTPVSTGCAVHTDPAAALVNALCEVVERDSIAVTWLQRLPLPRLDESCLNTAAREIISWCAARGIESYLFDATTDVGIPVVYCLQTTNRPRAANAAQLVGCACDFEVSRAAERALHEATAIRLGVQSRRSRPRRYDAFTRLADGAAVMGRRGKRRAFRFLIEDYRDRRRSTPASLPQTGAREQLALLLKRLSGLGLLAYAVDLTTRELEEIGMAAVRALVPGLQPLPTRALAQYRAHPRLMAAPKAMGLPRVSASRLNPYPQPMA